MFNRFINIIDKIILNSLEQMVTGNLALFLFLVLPLATYKIPFSSWKMNWMSGSFQNWMNSYLIFSPTEAFLQTNINWSCLNNSEVTYMSTDSGREDKWAFQIFLITSITPTTTFSKI